MRVLIKNISEIYTATNGRTKVKKNASIIIKDNIIEKIIDEYNYDDKVNGFDRIIDASGKMLLPGLVNTHTHAAMTLLRGYADDLSLENWLENKIWPFEATLNGDEIYWGSKLAIMEMIKSGTTTFVDMYFQMSRVAEAVKESGIRAVLSEGLIEINDGEKGLNSSLDFCLEWNNEANGRIFTMLAPHAPYTCSRNYLEKIIKYSYDHNLSINIHV